ncbi:YdhR family protein [Pseudochelatococcus sp. B33]
MSVALIVNYKWNVDWETAKYPTPEEAAVTARGPGIQWKLWLRDEKNKRRGSVYLFVDRRSAEAWLAKVIDRFLERDPDFVPYIFDVDEVNSRVTRAPLDVQPETFLEASAS